VSRHFALNLEVVLFISRECERVVDALNVPVVTLMVCTEHRLLALNKVALSVSRVFGDARTSRIKLVEVT